MLNDEGLVTSKIWFSYLDENMLVLNMLFGTINSFWTIVYSGHFIGAYLIR